MTSFLSTLSEPLQPKKKKNCIEESLIASFSIQNPPPLINFQNFYRSSLLFTFSMPVCACVHVCMCRVKGSHHVDERRRKEDDGEDITDNTHLIHDPFVVRHKIGIVGRDAENCD